MPIVNPDTGTQVDEIAANVFRISTPIPPSAMPGGFSFNQILIADDAPLLFHTGPRRMFPLVRQAVEHVLGDVQRLRYVGFSHVEADECGSLNEWLAHAPSAVPVCSQVAAMVSINDLADRPAHGLADGEELVLGSRRVRWLDAPHVPHNWECGYLFETTTRTLLCGDLFTQPGDKTPALTRSEILSASEAARPPDAAAIGANTRQVLEKLARTEPKTLAVMHGSCFEGDGSALLRELANRWT